MKIGDTIKPIRISGGHNYTINKKYIIAMSNGPGSWVCRDPENGWLGNNINESDMILYQMTKSEIDKRVIELDTELSRQKMMLTYLVEENKEDVDNNEFFAWYIVKIIESTDPHKKEKISKLLNTMNNNVNIDIITSY